jgi:hypothetical protein
MVATVIGASSHPLDMKSTSACGESASWLALVEGSERGG